METGLKEVSNVDNQLEGRKMKHTLEIKATQQIHNTTY